MSEIHADRRDTCLLQCRRCRHVAEVTAERAAEIKGKMLRCTVCGGRERFETIVCSRRARNERGAG